MDQPDGALLARTHDGEPDWAYGAWPDVGLCSVGLQRSGRTPPPCARWSPDSRWAVIARTDQRAVRQLRLTDPLGLDGHVTEHLQRVPLPGDAHLPLTTLILLDVRSPGFVALDLPPLVSNYAPIVPETADPVLAALLPSDIGIVRWIGDRLVIINEQRGWKAVHVLVVDPATRVVEERLHETGSTHVQLAAQRYPAQLTLLSDGSLVFYSERSGWGQLWLKPPQGEPRALTQGAWTVRHLHRVDEARRTVVFSASGREPGVDPYYRLLYSLPLDGGEPRRWTPEDADHEVHFDEPRRRWVAQWSRVDHPGARVEFDEDGATVNEHPIESPYEDAQLRAAPRRFCVKAADGVTPLYGVLFMPLQRTPGARIPLLDYMYG
ncbi:MAG TPA: DPP IV N-terminal domain-containing protein, partial [Rubrivivax sp.]|nr:DPP IV N-terminal domain-containing protein [Rubrivivax sp.]